MSAEHVAAFLDALRENDALQEELSTLPEGDWEAIIKLAGENGFNFTTGELISALPESFFKGHGTHPERGWDKPAIQDG
jgi:predicted ribosomally synthesized peptide with nif11-like leader